MAKIFCHNYLKIVPNTMAKNVKEQKYNPILAFICGDHGQNKIWNSPSNIFKRLSNEN